MSSKIAPLGVCDHCGNPIPRDEWYTSKGQPRRFCSLECKQTANSRAGNPERVRKLNQRIKSGTWRNPRSVMTPDQIHEVQSRASRKARLKEIEEGRWINPALSESARKVNALKNRLKAFFNHVDAQTSSSSIIIAAHVMPAWAKSARVQYTYGKLRIVPLPTRPRGNPSQTPYQAYALWFDDNRVRISSPRLIREIGVPRGKWRCVENGSVLVFERK